MSNYPPNYPPGGQPPGYPPGTPPQGYPPPNYQGAPPPGYPYGQPPPKKSNKVLIWSLVGCGGLIVIGIITVVLAGFWVRNKAREAGLDPELWEKQPALAAAKFTVAMNPDLEIVSVDEGKGLITFKEKKTGKVFTVDVKDAQDGEVSIRDEKGKGGTISVKGDESGGSIEMKTDEGMATIGSSGDARLPGWFPSYPGASLKGVYSTKNSDSESAGFQFTTSDSPEEVIHYYESALKAQGIRVYTSKTRQGDKEYSQVSGSDSSGNRTAFVNAATEGGETTVTMNYVIKR
jgi:hypothetical protein